MSTRHWMPLHIGDYLKNTRHLDAAGHGAYLLLIMHYWEHGRLPNNDVALARIACMSPQQWAKRKSSIQSFFIDGWNHKRVDDELRKEAELSNKRKDAALQKQSKCRANAEQLDTQPQPQKKEREDIAPSGASNVVKLREGKEASREEREDKREYFFKSGVIKLTEKNFRRWEKAYSHLDLIAELTSLSDSPWAASLPENNWFFPVSGALNKRNRAVAAGVGNGKEPTKWQYGIEGIV